MDCGTCTGGGLVIQSPEGEIRAPGTAMAGDYGVYCPECSGTEEQRAQRLAELREQEGPF